MSQAATTDAGQPAAASPSIMPTIVEKLELFGHAALTAVEHTAIRLVGDVAEAEMSLKSVVASSSLFQTAWAAGQASAIAHGVPLGPIENVFEAVMAKAQEFVASLKQPAPVPVPAPNPAPAPIAAGESP